METRKPGSAQSDATAVQFDGTIVELDNLDTAPHADEPIPFRLTAWGECRGQRYFASPGAYPFEPPPRTPEEERARRAAGAMGWRGPLKRRTRTVLP